MPMVYAVGFFLPVFRLMPLKKTKKNAPLIGASFSYLRATAMTLER